MSEETFHNVCPVLFVKREELAPTHGEDYTRLGVPEMELLRTTLEAADQR